MADSRRLEHETSSYVGAGNTPLNTMPCRVPSSAMQTLLKAIEPQHVQLALVWRQSSGHHATTIAQDVATATWRLEKVASSCVSDGITIGHDAMPPLSVVQTLLRANELQSATSFLWRPSLSRHAYPVAQDDGMVVRRLENIANCSESIGGIIGHDVNLSRAALSLLSVMRTVY